MRGGRRGLHLRVNIGEYSPFAVAIIRAQLFCRPVAPPCIYARLDQARFTLALPAQVSAKAMPILKAQLLFC